MKSYPSLLAKKHVVITCIMEIKSKDPFLGQMIRGYYLEELLEHGDLAVVYRARTEELWQVPELIVTILLVPDTLSEQARNQFTVRFMEKGRKLARLRHPHLYPLYGYGEQDGFFYLLTPPAQEETLAKQLQREGPWSAVDVLSILVPLASVIDYLHSQALVYKFLNPAHVLLLSDQTVLLSGLALAQLLSMQALNQGAANRINYEHLKSISGMFLGVPEYLASEVVKGAEADHRSDIYALGILLFELLSGRPPFSGKNYLDIAQKHLREPLPSLHEISSDIPVVLDIVLNRASHYNMHYRFQTAKNLADAYAHVIDTRVNTPKPGSFVRAIQQARKSSTTKADKAIEIGEGELLPEREDILFFEKGVPNDSLVASKKNAVIASASVPAISLTHFPQEAVQSEALAGAPCEKNDVHQTNQATHLRIGTMASQLHRLKERLQAQAQAMTHPINAPPDKN